VAFAVRYAWSKGLLERERQTIATLRSLNLVDPPGLTRLMREMRRQHVQLGDLLVRAGALDHRTLKAALDLFWIQGERLGAFLVDRKLVSAEAVEQALSGQAGPPFNLLGLAVDLGLLGESEAARIELPALT